jgi:crotonobetainyl-CoA:carnitine CoA-transferase CaiB-like acyl-CoA transferase
VDPKEGSGDDLRTKTLADWVELAAQHCFGLAPAYQDIDDVVDDPHIKSRNVFDEGDIRTARFGAVRRSSRVTSSTSISLGSSTRSR